MCAFHFQDFEELKYILQKVKFVYQPEGEINNLPKPKGAGLETLIRP